MSLFLPCPSSFMLFSLRDTQAHAILHLSYDQRTHEREYNAFAIHAPRYSPESPTSQKAILVRLPIIHVCDHHSLRLRRIALVTGDLQEFCH